MTMRKDELAGLTILGHTAKPSKKLETFPNRHPARRYVVTLSTDEFTCVCPMTGQPDFGTITIKYIPDQRIVESKSLKLYLGSYRNEGIFQEHLVNRICDDLVAALDPYTLEVTGAFKARGGIYITVVATHDKSPRRNHSAVSTPHKTRIN